MGMMDLSLKRFKHRRRVSQYVSYAFSVFGVYLDWQDFIRKSKDPLFRNKRLALNLMPQRNASKFAMFYVYENPHSFFRFSFCATLYFYLMSALVYVCPALCRHRPEHSLGKNIKLHEMKNEKNYMGFLITKIWQILRHFSKALS